MCAASEWLQEHGRYREGLQLLKPFLKAAIQSEIPPPHRGKLLGVIATAHADLGEVEKAIEHGKGLCGKVGDGDLRRGGVSWR